MRVNRRALAWVEASIQYSNAFILQEQVVMSKSDAHCIEWVQRLR